MPQNDAVVPVLEGRGLVKQFDTIRANDQLDFILYPGEVHALLGENGAGKSTLMKLFYGLYQPDEGEIWMNGRPVDIHHPADAIRLGIGMVHQELMLIPYMTVAENIVLGREMRQNRYFLDMAAANEAVRSLSQEFGLELDPAVPVGKLHIGLQQRVEIVKLLYRHANILILDEPTALLAPQEVDGLFRVIRQLAGQGKSVIFITHKLKEVFRIADRITVLRKGRVVDTVTPEGLTEHHLAEMMVGRELVTTTRKAAQQAGETRLEVRDITVKKEDGRKLLDGVSFQIRAGEILGVAGIEGNGQRELVEAIAGLRPIESGSVLFEGRPLEKLPVGRVRRLGVGLIPDDRQRLGLIMPFKISENLVLNRYAQPPFARGVHQRWSSVVKFAKEISSLFDVRTTNVQANVGTLSGGNQQKVVVGREMSVPLRLLIASQPTRGVDIGSVEFIYQKITETAEAGAAVLLISSDLDELLARTDRIIVLLRGRLVGTVETAQANKELLGKLMLGVIDQNEALAEVPEASIVAPVR